MDKFIVKPNKNESVVFAIRIDKDIQERYDKIAQKTNRSRNQLINMALKYALDNLKLEE
jgi:predicted transcriptional regulator